MPEIELYGTASCPFTRDAREALQWKRRTFAEYDVDVDADALGRLVLLTGQRAVPVLVEDGRVVEIGWQGRSCVIGSAAPAATPERGHAEPTAVGCLGSWVPGCLDAQEKAAPAATPERGLEIRAKVSASVRGGGGAPPPVKESRAHPSEGVSVSSLRPASAPLALRRAARVTEARGWGPAASEEKPEQLAPAATTASAKSVHIHGVVQGVGFRPSVVRLAREHALTGFVLNAESGVVIHLEGPTRSLDAFLRALKDHPPPAATIASLDVEPATLQGFSDFTIRTSSKRNKPTVRVSPDLCVCADCLGELFAADNARARYPYINCTNCGPRYSIIEGLPYDRAQTTMRGWRLCAACERQYRDADDRRFHAQPIACHDCGPRDFLRSGNGQASSLDGVDPIRGAAELMTQGRIVAIKGLGGYHLACDAANPGAVGLLRARKFRKEQPFALMARDLEVATRAVHLSDPAIALLESIARPIVLAQAVRPLVGVAPDNRELGVMLPYAPLHHLLFSQGAPPLLVMTSANRSGEPLAYQDEDAFDRLAGIADAFLVGERPIARRVDDSVIRIGPCGPTILRRARGYAPGAVAAFPIDRPVLALGADLKNSVTLVVEGQAFMSQFIGDLEDARTDESFQATIRDLMRLYDVSWQDVLVACDAHPGYRSTGWAERLATGAVHPIQHHRAHLASVLAEREEWDTRVVGASFDGTGYGDDGSTWGGEIFVGSVRDGFGRVAGLRPVRMAGGDAAARHPVQAAAGFLEQLDDLPGLTRAPFNFPKRFSQASALLRADIRVGVSTSMGRLFDTIAALIGFTRSTTFEGQAAVWLEHLAGEAGDGDASPFPFHGGELDFRPLLADVIARRLAGEPPAEIARAAQAGIAHGVHAALTALALAHGVDTAVLSGGVFQNHLLLNGLYARGNGRLRLWTNHVVPPNDGGISLGQAALAALARRSGS